MKYSYIWIIVCLALAASAFAQLPELPRDLTGQKLQGFAPDGRKTVSLTVVSTPVDNTSDVKWSVYTPTACKFRLQSTATKAGPTLTLAANATTEKTKNSSTPFTNFTGCTNGELTRQ